MTAMIVSLDKKVSLMGSYIGRVIDLCVAYIGIKEKEISYTSRNP